MSRAKGESAATQKRREKIQNKSRIEYMCSQEYLNIFANENPQIAGYCMKPSAFSGQLLEECPAKMPILHNAPNKDLIEARKKQLNITNDDISDIFLNLTGYPMNITTFRNKLSKQTDFNSLEILILSHILGLNQEEMLDYFNLRRKDKS